MANKIILKKTSTASKVPLSTDLEVGEIAVNLADQKLYSKNAGGTVILVGSGGGGSGDVVGPASATDNALVRFDSTTGKLIQNGTVTQDDNGTLANVNAISLDTTPTSAPTSAGSIYWDSGNQTPTVVLNANTDLQLGQENIALVYNGTGATIAAGSVVAVSGAQGQRPSVSLADADSEPLSSATLGITAEAIANGAEGFVCTFGLVRGINTSAFSAGQAIYLSQTAGAFTATRPSAPAHTVALGWVIKVNASSGEVFVNINNGWELDELHNVLITSPASGNTLIYDATAGVWKNANLTDGTGISITEGAGSITIANSGVTAIAGTAGEVEVSASTGSVTVGLPATAVTAGSYTNTNLTVDANGRITSASNGSAGGVTSVTGTAPISSSGGATPAISISQATTSTNGYLSSTDWNTFNGKGTGTVTSVGGTGTVNGLTLTGTVTTTGNLTLGGTLSGTAASLTAGAATTATNQSGGTVNATTGSFSGLVTGATATTADINVANDTGSFSCRGNASFPASMSFHRTGVYAINMGLSTGNNFVIGGWSASSNAFSMTGAGALTMLNNITAYSDERVKTNWRDLPTDFINQLANVKHGIYDRTDQISTQIGVGAQSLRPVMEHAVIEDENGNLSVAYGNAALVAAIQLSKAVVAMQKRIDFLEFKLKD